MSDKQGGRTVGKHWTTPSVDQGKWQSGKTSGRRFSPGPRVPRVPCSPRAAPHTRCLPCCHGHCGVSCVLLLTLPSIHPARLCQVHLQDRSKVLLRPEAASQECRCWPWRVTRTSGLGRPKHARVPARCVVPTPREPLPTWARPHACSGFLSPSPASCSSDPIAVSLPWAPEDFSGKKQTRAESRRVPGFCRMALNEPGVGSEFSFLRAGRGTWFLSRRR